MFTNVNVFWMSRFASRHSLCGVPTLAFINERTLLGALGVNMLARKRFW